MINDKAKSQLTQLSANEAEYTKMLEKLWVQACFQLLEDDTVVTCREKDVALLQVCYIPYVTYRMFDITTCDVSRVVGPSNNFSSLSQEMFKLHIKKRQKRI